MARQSLKTSVKTIRQARMLKFAARKVNNGKRKA